MPVKKSVEAHHQYLELERDSKFELRAAQYILAPARDKIMDHLYPLIFEESGLNSPACDEFEIDQVHLYGWH